MRIGDRHDPLMGAFMNGTVEGEDVFIPRTELLGGQVLTPAPPLYVHDGLARPKHYNCKH